MPKIKGWDEVKDLVVRKVKQVNTKEEILDYISIVRGCHVSWSVFSRQWLRWMEKDQRLIRVESLLGSERSDSTREAEIIRYKTRARDAETSHRTTLRKLIQTENALEAALGLKAGKLPAPIQIRKSLTERQATPFAIASDWHVEEIVDPTTVNGLNEYNPDIARARATKFFEGVIWEYKHNATSFAMPEMVLALLGDMITGYIHEELVESNAMSPTEAVLFCLGLIISGIDAILDELPIERLVVPCCHGNHGRTTPRRRISTGAKNSYEWLMYHILKLHYQDNDRVEFLIAGGSLIYHQVYDFNIRFHHGDDLKYNGGWGGLAGPAKKAVSSWDASTKAYLTIIGHYHHFLDLNYCMINSSLIGYSAYTQHIKAPYAPPSQTFFLIDSKYGKTHVTPLWVE